MESMSGLPTAAAPIEAPPSSTLAVKADLEDPEPLAPVRAEPPTMQVNFLPVRVSTATLEALKLQFDATVTMREGPSPEAPVTGTLSVGDSYFVLQHEGAWSRVKTSKGASGWLRLATLGDQADLEAVQDVPAYANAMLAYISEDHERARRLLGQYLSGSGKAQDSMNRSLALITLGNALRALGPWDDDLRDRALKAYAEAAALLPRRAAPWNYVAVAQLQQWWDDDYGIQSDVLRELEAHLVEGVQHDHDLVALDNLRALYGAPFATSVFGTGQHAASQLATQQERLVDLRRRIASAP